MDELVMLKNNIESYELIGYVNENCMSIFITKALIEHVRFTPHEAP